MEADQGEKTRKGDDDKGMSISDEEARAVIEHCKTEEEALRKSVRMNTIIDLWRFECHECGENGLKRYSDIRAGADGHLHHNKTGHMDITLRLGRFRRKELNME